MIIETRWTETGWTYRIVVERFPPPGEWIGFYETCDAARAAGIATRQQLAADLDALLPGLVPLLRVLDVLD